MSLEDTLSGWTGPSSDTEQDKQDRTKRMVQDAVDAHDTFEDCRLSVYPTGSYANNTNVRADSDVDIAVQCHNVEYWEEETPGAHPLASPYEGIWTPEKLRSELVAALKAKFPGQVDTSGSTAIQVNSSSARVVADIVSCFDFRYYFTGGGSRPGTKIFPRTGSSFENHPAQHLEKGKQKNTRTNTRFKKSVRIMKRVENAMLANCAHRELPSFFVECLVYNCPDAVLTQSTWTEVVRGILVHVWNGLEGAEPTDNSERWLEVNECKYLFFNAQKWTRAEGRDFAKAAWNYLGYKS